MRALSLFFAINTINEFDDLQPIQVREFDTSKKDPVKLLGVFSHNIEKIKKLVDLALVLESGRRVACDIGDADPERMSPPRVEQYIHELFDNSSIKVQVWNKTNSVLLVAYYTF